MTNQKNRFFTFIFSCCPGAGEMYLGLYRHGIGLMGLFFGTIVFALWLDLWFLPVFLCPIVWCYSFFHTHNLRGMSEEAFAAVADRFFFEDYVHWKRECRFSGKQRRIFGGILLFVALSALLRQVLYLLQWENHIPYYFWGISRAMPQVILALLIFAGAIRLMRTPKEETAEEVAEAEA